MKYNNLVFLCGARDFHAMDWYASAKEVTDDTLNISIVTDLIQGEGFSKLVDSSDKIFKLLILDKLLFRKQSKLGNLWRNILKLFFLPIQVLLLRRFESKNENSIYFAHSMYYLWLAHFAGVDFVGTPQGSDLLIKPFKSKLFKYLSIKALRSAKFITVDSEMMRAKCIQISAVDPIVIQNGIDLNSINKKVTNNLDYIESNNKILSLRGFTDLYRVDQIIKSRKFSKMDDGINFIYPFYDKSYKSIIDFNSNDMDLGRVSRQAMYNLLNNTILSVSIPYSDSSPRSVYEAIFCNSIVAITHHRYYNDLPKCMQSRIILVKLDDKNWLNKAYEKAKKIKIQNFKPSKEALDLFDQKRSFNKKLNLLKQIND